MKFDNIFKQENIYGNYGRYGYESMNMYNRTEMDSEL
jgi:hypothetical protein